MLQANAHPEGTAIAGYAAYTDFTAHQLRQALADRQAQAGATVAAGGGIVGLLEGAEYRGLLLLAEADTVVLDLEAQAGAVEVFA